MAVSHGMDVGEVRRLGGSLQTSAGSIDDLIRRIENAVSGSTWVGADATMFKGTWWPEHRTHLVAMSEKLHGLGQSALNNAREQEKASGAIAAGTIGTNGPQGNNWNPQGGERVPETAVPGSGASPSGAESGDVGATSGQLPGSDRSWQEIQKAYEGNGARLGLGPYLTDPGLRYQCTAWAEYRWRELADQQGIDIDIAGGWGGAKALENGGSIHNPPSLGAMVSRTDIGHVMIVEEIATTPEGLTSIRVSEMNARGWGETWYVDGKAYPGLEGLPREYNSESTYVQQGDGSWILKQDNGSKKVGDLVFADFPTGG